MYPARSKQLDPGHASMRATRAALPAAAKRGELLAAAAGSDVLVISGATGCGKSTQVQGRQGSAGLGPGGDGGHLRQWTVQTNLRALTRYPAALAGPCTKHPHSPQPPAAPANTGPPFLILAPSD
jgi:hypothetical protein